jgi:hypothetical protein
MITLTKKSYNESRSQNAKLKETEDVAYARVRLHQGSFQ